ncbi:N-acetylmuramoyl-L-alanine amidase [Rhodobacter viridis]|uniref:N-acetylmuramoyl-L-alanine amidase n=1 Tax=Rhodobacter viridis TaxID=1054202 RepID=A0A318TZ64_9RHOB|nr:N-acetylmuramoyl-L-alanine amidase [Rhodobacter viridis]
MTETPVSPNFGERRGGAQPELIVLHYTGMTSCALARERLCDPAAEVSAHWLIGEDGTVEALVPETMRAWHAGRAAGWGRRM